MVNGQEFLEDKKNDKVIKWQEKHLASLNVSDSYSRLYTKYKNAGKSKEMKKLINNYEKKSLRVKDCGTYLEYKVYTATNEKKLHDANFCKVRLCPMCAWRRSLKIFGQVSQVMNIAKGETSNKFIFVTLTQRNVTGEELKEEIDNLYKSFNRLMLRKKIKQMSLGWFRALEVTYNSDVNSKDYNTFHPHFHVVIMVKSFYEKNKNLYIEQAELTEMWKQSLKIDYTPIVHMEAVKIKKGKTIETAVAEIAKYTVKESDLIIKDQDGCFDLDQTDENIRILDDALAYRRLTAFGGQLKEIHNLLKLDDAENGDLINTDQADIENNDLEYVIEKYFWHVGFSNYVKIQEKSYEIN
ncbi:replication protein [Acetobacterium malicum]|uniref:Replication protein n=1 Tax=Acetobacterium malicum TaxID=52692 RepID=A0ABR6Z2H1_9FIRM|nr:protein rep [Acetobacterium malicum]MBC3901707.1 replication protein [Acetobacterium malicum]